MTSSKFICLFIIFIVITRETSALCKCDIYHTQEKLCNSTFIALVRVFDNQIRAANLQKIKSPDSRLQGLSKAHLFKMLKGRYEDFREGSSITLLTPSGECGIKPLSGFMLIAGHVLEVGVVVLDSCSLRVKSLSSTQMSTIQHNIKTRAYTRGCRECNIRKEYDYSYLNEDECRANYEFPVSTSACIRNHHPGKSGAKCEWIRRASFPVKNNYYLSRVLPRVIGYEEPVEVVTSQPEVFTARIPSPQLPIRRDSLPVVRLSPPPTEKKSTVDASNRMMTSLSKQPEVVRSSSWKRRNSPVVEVSAPEGEKNAVSNYRILHHSLKSKLFRIVVNATWPEEQD